MLFALPPRREVDESAATHTEAWRLVGLACGAALSCQLLALLLVVKEPIVPVFLVPLADVTWGLARMWLRLIWY